MTYLIAAGVFFLTLLICSRVSKRDGSSYRRSPPPSPCPDPYADAYKHWRQIIETPPPYNRRPRW